MEIWKKIKGYENFYEVSNKGRVKSFHGRGRILRPAKTPDGYCTVRLCVNGGKTFYVHRLVAEHFIPNPENHPVINHKNQDPSDNRVDNIEWCSHQYNATYAGAHDKRGLSYRKKLYQYDSKGNLVNTFDSAVTAAKKLPYATADLIYLCCNNRTKRHAGYVWSYSKMSPELVHRKLNAKKVGDKFKF